MISLIKVFTNTVHNVIQAEVKKVWLILELLYNMFFKLLMEAKLTNTVTKAFQIVRII